MRRDTIVQTHVLDAEYDSAPPPLPPLQVLSGAQGSPGRGHLRLAPTPSGGPWHCWPEAGPGRTGALATPRAGPCWGVTHCTLGFQGIFILFWLFLPRRLLIFYF